MTIAKEVVQALHERLKKLSLDATAEQLAYLAKALESVAGQSTVYDVVNIAEEKLKALLDAANTHLASLNNNKKTSLTEIDKAKTTSVEAINALKTESITALQTATTQHTTLLDTRKEANITAINNTGKTQQQALTTAVSKFEKINDVPVASSIMTEIGKQSFIAKGALPFIFAVLSRANDHFGVGDLTNQLGAWHNDVANTDNMLQLLTGIHTYKTEYAGFYRPPQLYFLQGLHGNFIYKEMYLKHVVHTNEYTYPYAGLGVFFIKNTTMEDITRALSFGGSVHWSSGYEGMGLFLAVPDDSNINRSSISKLTWSNLYNNTTSSPNIAGTVNITIPAGKTVAILLYTSAHYQGTAANHYTQFLHWYIHSFRSGFLTDGLVVDEERTLKAWQCPGLEKTFELWK